MLGANLGLLLYGEVSVMPRILSVFPNEFNKFNITGARRQDSIYHMILKSNFISDLCTKSHDFDLRKRDIFMDVKA